MTNDDGQITKSAVPVDVYVTVDIDHPRPADLSVILEDPNGQQGTIALDGKVTQTAVQAFPGDDMVGGMWTLRVTDTVEGETGILNGWSVYILSNWD